MSAVTEREIASQPELWRRAAALAGPVADVLPRPGERVAFVGDRPRNLSRSVVLTTDA